MIASRGRKTSLLARLGAALVVAVIAVAVAGCGSTVIDQQKVEEQVKESSEKISGAKVSSVECPSGVDVEPGATFACSVKFSSGKEETAKLMIRDKEADVNFEALSPDK